MRPGRPSIRAIAASAGFAIACALAPTDALGAEGDPDPSFSGDGTLVQSFGAGHISGAEDVAVDALGNIVAVGVDWSAATQENIALARYDPNGQLDPGFSGDGLQITDVLGDDRAQAVAIDSQGRIVIAGVQNGDFDNLPNAGDLLVARYLPNGTLDGAFGGGDGVATANFTNQFEAANAVTIDSQGRIVAAGTGVIMGDRAFVAARFTPAGLPDNSFSVDGKQFIQFGAFNDIDVAHGVVTDSQNRVVLVGASFDESNINWNFAVARLTQGGELDPGFGAGGKVEAIFNDPVENDYARDVVIDSAGNLIVATERQPQQAAVGLAKLDGVNGALVSGFGNGGIAVSNVSAGSNGVGLDASGRILVGAGYTAGLPERLFAVRFAPGGFPDSSFGGDGAGEAVIGSPFFNGGMAVDNADRPIVSGGFDNTVDPPVGTFALARFQAGSLSQAAPLCLGKVPDIVGTEGKDAIQGTSDPDVIDAGAGNDKVTGFGGKDRICGGRGKDRLFGGPGKDRIQGGPGNDLLRGGKGKDRLKGGKGKDDVRQ